MELVIDKCAVMYVKKGFIVESEGVMLSGSTKLRSLFATIIYMYLGFSVFGNTRICYETKVPEKLFWLPEKYLKIFYQAVTKREHRVFGSCRF